MTRPTPPEPYETWLDWYLDIGDAFGEEFARAELAELRADRDHWRTSQKTTQAKGELMLSELAELRATIEVLRGERDDAMTGIIWEDDSQVTRVYANKCFGSPGTHVRIEWLG